MIIDLLVLPISDADECRFKSETDVRNTLIATCLSFVEHFRPSYVVIENVANMARFKLCGREKDGKIADGIEWGTHKFVLRTFLDLGSVWVKYILV